MKIVKSLTHERELDKILNSLYIYKRDSIEEELLFKSWEDNRRVLVQRLAYGYTNNVRDASVLVIYKDRIERSRWYMTYMISRVLIGDYVHEIKHLFRGRPLLEVVERSGRYGIRVMSLKRLMRIVMLLR